MFGTAAKKYVFALMLELLLLPVGAMGDAGVRRVKSKVDPDYPRLARELHLAGTVRLEVVIGLDGRVKSVKPLGGHPLLVQSAEQAIRRWRYEPGPETTTIVEFRFHE